MWWHQGEAYNLTGETDCHTKPQEEKQGLNCVWKSITCADVYSGLLSMLNKNLFFLILPSPSLVILLIIVAFMYCQQKESPVGSPVDSASYVS